MKRIAPIPYEMFDTIRRLGLKPFEEAHLWRDIFTYIFDGTLPNLNGLSTAPWNLCLPTLEKIVAERQRYSKTREKVCEKARAARKYNRIEPNKELLTFDDLKPRRKSNPRFLTDNPIPTKKFADNILQRVTMVETLCAKLGCTPDDFARAARKVTADWIASGITELPDTSENRIRFSNDVENKLKENA